MTGVAQRVLDEIEGAAPHTVEMLAELVRIPSVSGSDAESEIQARLATWFRAEGFEVDHWRIPVAELSAEPDFPGMEVPRGEAWGLVARLPGRDGGRSLMLNGHVDVVPPGTSPPGGPGTRSAAA